jgi:hypothetical protein
MSALIRLCAPALLVALLVLGGCIVAPPYEGGYGRGYEHHSDRGYYGGGGGWGEHHRDW